MQKTQSSTTTVAVVLVILITVGSWLLNRIPEQAFWYDQTQACPVGTTLGMSGNALVCR
jgi:hypothetical protein